MAPLGDSGPGLQAFRGLSGGSPRPAPGGGGRAGQRHPVPCAGRGQGLRLHCAVAGLRQGGREHLLRGERLGPPRGALAAALEPRDADGEGLCPGQELPAAGRAACEEVLRQGFPSAEGCPEGSVGSERRVHGPARCLLPCGRCLVAPLHPSPHPRQLCAPRPMPAPACHPRAGAAPGLRPQEPSGSGHPVTGTSPAPPAPTPPWALRVGWTLSSPVRKPRACRLGSSAPGPQAHHAVAWSRQAHPPAALPSLPSLYFLPLLEALPDAAPSPCSP